LQRFIGTFSDVEFNACDAIQDLLGAPAFRPVKNGKKKDGL